MHMQQGIGRAGFRLLALVFFAIGLGGLLMAWAATTDGAAAFLHVGLALSAVGLMFLLGATLAASVEWEEPEEATADPRPQGPAAGPPAGDWSPEPPRSLDFEYTDHQVAARAAPETLVMPPSFQQETPGAPAPRAPAHQAQAAQAAAGPQPVAGPQTAAPAAGPRNAPPTGGPPRAAPAAPQHVPRTSSSAPQAPRRPEGAPHWPTPRGAHGLGRAPVWEPPASVEDKAGPEARQHMRERYTRNTPLLRDALSTPAAETPSVPEVRAEPAPDDLDPDWLPDGQTVGRCSGCQTRVLAPTARPVVLVCVCGRKKRLD